MLVYNWSRLKSNNNTQCLEKLCKMGFGSLEAALTTTADVALQIALAGGLGRAGGAAGIINADSERLSQKHKTKQKCQ
jgi:hypothetical protein